MHVRVGVVANPRALRLPSSTSAEAGRNVLGLYNRATRMNDRPGWIPQNRNGTLARRAALHGSRGGHRKSCYGFRQTSRGDVAEVRRRSTVWNCSMKAWDAHGAQVEVERRTRIMAVLAAAMKMPTAVDLIEQTKRRVLPS